MKNDLHRDALSRNFDYARENRKVSTAAEALLWSHLRNRKLRGFKFRRQHPIFNFIADFYCHERKLIVELDGEYHYDIEQRQYDKGRTFELNELKIDVIRFSNQDVLENINLVLERITEYSMQRRNQLTETTIRNADGITPLLQERGRG